MALKPREGNSRTALMLGMLAIVIAASAMVVAIVALVSTSDGVYQEEILVVDRDEVTVGMVLDAVEMYEEEGLEATLEYYNSSESMNGEWYVFIYDEQEKLIATGHPELLGMDLEEVSVDSTGYWFGDVIRGATEDGVWVDYVFENPVTGKQEYKHTWVVRIDGLIFGSGWYSVLPDLSP